MSGATTTPDDEPIALRPRAPRTPVAGKTVAAKAGTARAARRRLPADTPAQISLLLAGIGAAVLDDALASEGAAALAAEQLVAVSLMVGTLLEWAEASGMSDATAPTAQTRRHTAGSDARTVTLAEQFLGAYAAAHPTLAARLARMADAADADAADAESNGEAGREGGDASER